MLRDPNPITRGLSLPSTVKVIAFLSTEMTVPWNGYGLPAIATPSSAGLAFSAFAAL
jgi:hypothetical protein